MEAMASIVQIICSGGYGFAVSEIGPLQRSIMEVFKLLHRTSYTRGILGYKLCFSQKVCF
jgi:hypothetical protein